MIISTTKYFFLVIVFFQLSAHPGNAKEKTVTDSTSKGSNKHSLPLYQSTTFPQIHTNLNGMVREFVRTMYHDSKGNYWFGTNGNGIIRYDGRALEQITIEQKQQWPAVREIVEDKIGNIWFGTSSGLIKFDGNKFSIFSREDGLQNEDIWGLTVDANGLIWVGSIGGVSHFDGQTFTPFPLPETTVERPQYMLSDKLVLKFLEDRKGVMWLVTDGNGIFKYRNGEFTHLTTRNGLTDNNVADVLEDNRGNIWIGTFYGGVSTFDGTTFTHFTKNGIIEGKETYNFCEDRQGNIWFSAEGYGVYRYDGKDFSRFTSENGLTTNVVQSIHEDTKGQLWFGTWQGISIYDGKEFLNAKDKEPWTK